MIRAFETLTIRENNSTSRYTVRELREMARDVAKRHGKLKTWGLSILDGRTYLDAVVQRQDGSLTICGIAL